MDKYVHRFCEMIGYFKQRLALIISSSINSILKIIRGPVVVFLIIQYLSDEDQGYWYTFQSILTFAIIGDFGISRILPVILPNYTSKIKSSNSINQTKTVFSNLSSLIITYFLLYTLLVIIIYLGLLLFVFLFYNSWEKQYYDIWALCALGGAFNLFLTYFNTLLYSFNQIKIKNTVEIIMSTTYSIAIIFFLVNDFKLYSLAYSLLISVTLPFIYLIIKNRRHLRLFFYYFNFKNGWLHVLSSKKLQGRHYITSIMSLYISSFVVPMTMKIFDPVIAGKLGLTIFIISTITTFALTIDYIEYPSIIKTIAEKNFQKLRSKTKRIFLINNILYIFLSGIFLILIQVPLEFIIQLKNRLINGNLILYILITRFILMNIGYYANLIRGFQIEPFWKLGLFQVITTTILFVVLENSLSLKLFLQLDFGLHIFILVPLTIYLGREKNKILFQSS